MILGIDPGLEGCLAVLGLDKSFHASLKMPLTTWRKSRKKTNFKAVEQFVLDNQITHCVIEEPGLRKGQSIRGMETQSINWGILIAVLDCHMIPYELVAPVQWQKKVRIGGKGRAETKRQSLAMTNQLYPALGVTDDNLADAILIARSHYV